MRVLLSGAAGLIGARVTARLAAGGHTVVPLVRARGAAGVFYDPERGEIDGAALGAPPGFDAVIHLGGAGIAEGRWTAARRREIRDSRTKGTRLLAEALAGLARPPRVLVSASAIGYYGDRGDEPLTEEAPAGSGFLAEVCTAWEAAADPARAAGIRVVHPRIGIVLARNGGALARMLPVFRLGAGGPVGSGRQVMSWIAAVDVAGAIAFALESDALAGPINLTAPNPVTSAEFARTLGAVLHRPAVLPVPAVAISLAFGEMGRELLLGGARVLPARLTSAGFAFRHPELADALRSELG